MGEVRSVQREQIELETFKRMNPVEEWLIPKDLLEKILGQRAKAKESNQQTLFK